MNTRRYILLGLLVAVAIFDYLHIRARKQAAPPATAVQVAAPHSSEAQSAWTAYDGAARLRDGNTDAFHPALEAFNAAKEKVPATPGTYDAQDLESCRIWLLQYRNGTGMHDLAKHHVDSCTQLHRDVAQ